MSATPTTTVTYRHHRQLLHPVSKSPSVNEDGAPNLSTQSQFCESVNANSKKCLPSGANTSPQSGQHYLVHHSKHSRFTPSFISSTTAACSHQLTASVLLLSFLASLWFALPNWQTTTLPTFTCPSLFLFSLAALCVLLFLWLFSLTWVSVTQRRGHQQVNKCSSPSLCTDVNEQLYIEQPHLSLDECSDFLSNSSSQCGQVQPKSLPLISSSVRAISHFCTNLMRHILRYDTSLQREVYLSPSFLDSPSSFTCTSFLWHSQVRSRRQGVEGVLDAANKEVFTSTSTSHTLADMFSDVFSSKRKVQSSSSQQRHPHYLWFLCLSLLALSEPFLVTCSSAYSSSSIYSNGGSGGQLIAPAVYGLSNNNNRRQPKRNLHVGSQRSPVKPPSFTYFEEKDTSVRFSHMCVNVFNGRIYVGGDNGIYQLKMNGSNQLVLEEKAVMGPAEDNPECPANKNCPPNVTKKLSNYYNKALVIDMQHSWLISCGSLYQGACAAHNWNNVSQILHAPMESVVANNATASTVVFIAPGPPPHKYVLYVGATFTIGNYRSDVPAVSSRSLFESRKFSLNILLFVLFTVAC